jgi:cytochrome c oxidase subunit 2
MIPGHVNSVLLAADRAGVYRGECAEFCGLQHAHMGFFVIVQSQSDFQRWMTRVTRPPAAPTDDAALRGAALFQRLSCAGCHAVRGTSAAGTFGPDLSDFGQRRSIGALVSDNTARQLARWITNAPSMKPGVKMPPVPLSRQQTADLVAYLESLR